MAYEVSLPTIDPDEILKRALKVRIPGLRQKREPKYPELPAEEEKSLLGNVLAKGSGTLQYLGETLDKPGRAVRGLLAGQPGELANLIPFSDTMGITDPSKSVSGRDLLEKAGLLDKNTPGLDWGDVAGFGTEIATDPLSYLTFGASAIGKAGKVAKAAGISTRGASRFKTLGQHLATAIPEVTEKAAKAAAKYGGLEALKGQKLGGAFGLTTGPLGLLGLHGSYIPKVAQSEAAQKGLETLGKGIKAIPGVEALERGRRALFDYRVKGQVSHAGQALAQAQTEAAEKILPKATTDWSKLSRDLGNIQDAYRESFGSELLPENLPQAFEKMARMQAEGVRPTLASAFHELPHHPQTAAALQDALGRFGAAKDDLWNGALEMGLNSASMAETEGMKHIGRYATQKGEELTRNIKYRGTPDSALARTLPTKYLPADVVNAMFQDKDIAAITKQLAKPEKDFGLAGMSPLGMIDAFEHAQKAAKPDIVEIAHRVAQGLPQTIGGAAFEHGQPAWKSHKVIIADIYNAAKPELGNMTLDEFKQALLKAKNEGRAELSRLDLVKGVTDYDPATGLKRLEDSRIDLGHNVYADQLNANSANAIEAAKAKPQQITHATLQNLLLDKYGHFLDNAAVAEGIGPAEVAKRLAEHLAARNNAVQFFSKSGKDLYGSFTHDQLKYMTELARNYGDLAAIHNTLGKSLVPGGIPLEKVFADAGMNPNAATQFFAKKFGPVAQGMGVDPEVANAILAVTKKTQNPEWLEKLLKGSGKWPGIDGLTRMFKTGVTLPFPNFAVRNFYSGQAMNAFSGEIPDIQHLGSYLKGVSGAKDILKNPGKYGDLLDELAAHRVFEPHGLESLGVEIGTSGRLPNPSPLGALGTAIPSGLDVTQAFREGGGGLKGAAHLPVGVGANVNARVEFMNRVPMYLYLRKKLGWSAEQAAAKVRELQVDYSAMAPFEKAVMKRLVPFYSWQRKIMPVLMDQISQRPGGLAAQTVRASNIGRSENEFIPPYVGEGMSVNLGGDSYLSGLGLPTDQLGDLAVRGPTALSSVSRTGQKLLAQTNPLLKAPLELATGKNFFTGRDLADSYRYPTNNILLNEALYNTPAARAITTARTIGDERKSKATKAVNLLTGARITDVSGGLEKQQRIAESKILSELLRESPNIASSTDVFPKHDPATGLPVELSGEEERLYRAFMALKKRQAEEAKKRKKSAAL